MLLTRDTDELRFANDSSLNLINCRVEIDGGFGAALPELPAHGRGALGAAQFDEAMPRDEFFTRSHRSTTMTCMDEAHAKVLIALK